MTPYFSLWTLAREPLAEPEQQRLYLSGHSRCITRLELPLAKDGVKGRDGEPRETGWTHTLLRTIMAKIYSCSIKIDNLLYVIWTNRKSDTVIESTRKITRS